MVAIVPLFVTTIAIVLAAVAADPDMLQDVCVADFTAGVNVNGFPCKDVANISAADFFFDGLAKPAVINSTTGTGLTRANVQYVPGLNTLGVALFRIDIAPHGLASPHIHPRASEIAFVLEGELDAGFITTANVLISKTIKKGEVFVFPRGLVHFLNNKGKMPATVISGYNSQRPGTLVISNALFASTPLVPDNVLTKAFQVGPKEVQAIKSRFAPK